MRVPLLPLIPSLKGSGNQSAPSPLRGGELGRGGRPSSVNPKAAPANIGLASENRLSRPADSPIHPNQSNTGTASPSGTKGLSENPSPSRASNEAENTKPMQPALSLNSLPVQGVPAISDFKAGTSGNPSPAGTPGETFAEMAAARPPIAFKAILFSGKKTTEPASTLLGFLPSPSGGGSHSSRGTKDSNTEKPYAPFLPCIFRGQRGASWIRSASLLLPLLLLTLSVLAILFRAASSRRRRFSNYLDEALERHKRRNRDRLIRETRRAAQCNRPLRTLALPGVPSERGPVVDILVSEEPNPKATRHASLLDPALPSPTPGRILMALPQAAPEQILMVVQKTLYLFSRGQAIFAARIKSRGELTEWSPPLAVMPESGPGFSLTFHRRWFFLVPGAQHRAETPVYRCERYTDGAIGPWRVAGRLPSGLSHHALASTEKGLLLLGGNTQTGAVPWVFRFAIGSSGEMEALERTFSLPAPLCPARCMILKSSLFAWKGPEAMLGGEAESLWSTLIDSQGRPGVWRDRGPLPEPGGAEALLSKDKRLILIQRGRVYRTDWNPGGLLPPWRRADLRLPRHHALLILERKMLGIGDDHLFAFDFSLAAPKG